MTSDAAGQLYVLWNPGSVDRGPERIYFSTSTDQGNSWTPKADVSLAPSGVDHAFPSVAAGVAGDIRIAWMDQRNGPERHMLSQERWRREAGGRGCTLRAKQTGGQNRGMEFCTRPAVLPRVYFLGPPEEKEPASEIRNLNLGGRG